jgi:hypothetical protein
MAYNLARNESGREKCKMNKIAFAALLVAFFLQEKTGPAPVKPEVPSQNQPQTPSTEKPLVREFGINKEATQRLLDLGYFNFLQPRSAAAVPPTQCAIPLLQMRVPNDRSFAGKTIPANKSIDPKMVVPPPLPACSQTATPLTIVTPVAPTDKK